MSIRNRREGVVDTHRSEQWTPTNRWAGSEVYFVRLRQSEP
jgi:hypothetical protein